MKSLWLFAPQGAAREVLDRLAAMGLAHVTDCGLADSDEHEALGIERVYPEVGDIERKVQFSREALTILTRFHKSKKALLENFIPTPREVCKAEVQHALAHVNLEALHAEAKEYDRACNLAGQSLQKARENLKALAALEGVPGMLPGKHGQKNVAAFLGVLSGSNVEQIQADERLRDTFAFAVVAQKKPECVVQAVCPAAEAAELLNLLRESGMNLIEPDADTVTIPEYLDRRREEIRVCRAAAAQAETALKAFSKAHHEEMEIVLGYWEERLRIANTVGLMAASKRLTVLRAYVCEADLDTFRRRIQAELPQATLDISDPVPGDVVPVKLRNPRILASAEFLVRMFGMPNYFTFDPTPYIAATFLAFFGICFGDVLYGLLLVTLGILLAKKYRAYPGLRCMFSLFAWAGIPTIVMGLLSGTWAADLFTVSYLSADNPLVRLRNHFMHFDMIQKTMIALGAALLIGVANQFLSLICLMVRNVRQGDVKAAIFDGAFWLLVLPAVVVGSATLFVAVPGPLSAITYSAAGLGAVGLILTQGRAEKTFIGKAIIGAVSLYGIVGTYGITAFIGDILSYSRLLALGLTTGIVGMCFNLIGGMAMDLPYIGVVAGIVIIILGHTMNFLISVLGAFVHSSRLIFVEFFGKFYQGDAVAFAPLGAWSGRIRVVDSSTIWVGQETA